MVLHHHANVLCVKVEFDFIILFYYQCPTNEVALSGCVRLPAGFEKPGY